MSDAAAHGQDVCVEGFDTSLELEDLCAGIGNTILQNISMMAGKLWLLWRGFLFRTEKSLK